MACILLWSAAVRVHDPQAYRKMDVTRVRISRILLNPHKLCEWSRWVFYCSSAKAQLHQMLGEKTVHTHTCTHHHTLKYECSVTHQSGSCTQLQGLQSWRLLWLKVSLTGNINKQSAFAQVFWLELTWDRRGYCEWKREGGKGREKERGTDLKQAKVTQLSMRQMMEMVHPMYVISSRENRAGAGICGKQNGQFVYLSCGKSAVKRLHVLQKRKGTALQAGQFCTL